MFTRRHERMTYRKRRLLQIIEDYNYLYDKQFVDNVKEMLQKAKEEKDKEQEYIRTALLEMKKIALEKNQTRVQRAINELLQPLLQEIKEFETDKPLLPQIKEKQNRSNQERKGNKMRRLKF